MASRVATRLVVFAVPVFTKPKLTVTVSPGSIAPLVQLSATSVKLFNVMTGTPTNGASTVVMTAAVLLAGFGSEVGEVALKVLVIDPAAVGVTTTVKLVAPPLAIVPAPQTTFPPRLTQPGEAETNVTLAGKASVRVTLEAEAEPRLVTVSV